MPHHVPAPAPVHAAHDPVAHPHGDHSAAQKAALERVEAAVKKVKDLEARLNKPGQTPAEEKFDHDLLDAAKKLLAEAVKAAEALGVNPDVGTFVLPPFLPPVIVDQPYDHIPLGPGHGPEHGPEHGPAHGRK